MASKSGRGSRLLDSAVFNSVALSTSLPVPRLPKQTTLVTVPDLENMHHSNIKGDTLLALLGLIPRISGKPHDIQALSRHCALQRETSVTEQRSELQARLRTAVQDRYGEGTYERLDLQMDMTASYKFPAEVSPEQFVLASSIVAAGNQHLVRDWESEWEVSDWSAWIKSDNGLFAQDARRSTANYGSLRGTKFPVKPPTTGSSRGREYSLQHPAQGMFADESSDSHALPEMTEGLLTMGVRPADTLLSGHIGNMVAGEVVENDDSAIIGADVEQIDADQDIGDEDVGDEIDDIDEAAAQDAGGFDENFGRDANADDIIDQEDDSDREAVLPTPDFAAGEEQLPAGKKLLQYLGVWPFQRYDVEYSIAQIARNYEPTMNGMTHARLSKLVLARRNAALESIWGRPFARRYVDQIAVARVHGYDKQWIWAATATLEGIVVPPDVEEEVLYMNSIPDIGAQWAQGSLMQRP